MDVFHGDRFGRLGLTKQGLRQRDPLALDAMRRRGRPVAAVLGGGYARMIDDMADIRAAAAYLLAGVDGERRASTEKAKAADGKHRRPTWVRS